MVLVNVCPNNEHDVLQASNRLGCGNDRYGNNQYLCLPNKDEFFGRILFSRSDGNRGERYV